MKKRIFPMAFILIMVVLFIAGCSKVAKSIETDINEISIRYLEDRDYKIVSSQGKIFEYVLKKEDLLYPPYQKQWALQNVSPEDYVDKNIIIYETIVKNHILDGIEGNNKNQTMVKIMIVDNQVIGGYAIPDYGIPHYGGVFSLDGKTIEEITGTSFQQWQAEWSEKYK